MSEATTEPHLARVSKSIPITSTYARTGRGPDDVRSATPPALDRSVVPYGRVLALRTKNESYWAAIGAFVTEPERYAWMPTLPAT